MLLDIKSDIVRTALRLEASTSDIDINCVDDVSTRFNQNSPPTRYMLLPPALELLELLLLLPLLMAAMSMPNVVDTNCILLLVDTRNNFSSYTGIRRRTGVAVG